MPPNYERTPGQKVGGSAIFSYKDQVCRIKAGLLKRKFLNRSQSAPDRVGSQLEDGIAENAFLVKKLNPSARAASHPRETL